ncbi:MAG: AAA family ATPase, partial [Pseudomonadales bacterium]|nr:AAA family ATPase [Pseudomonadales bacterium]
MYIKRLEILDVRNLQSIKIDPSKRFNLVEGLNGSGKTSLLEAIHLLSLGRSFRTPKIRNVISNQASKCTIFSVLCNTQNDLGDRCDEGPGLRVGLEKIRDGKTI